MIYTRQHNVTFPVAKLTRVCCSIYYDGLVIILTTRIIIPLCAVDWIDLLPRADGNKMAMISGTLPEWIEPLMEYIQTLLQRHHEQGLELEALYEKTSAQEARIRDLTTRISTRDARICELERKLSGEDDERDDLSSTDDIASDDTATALAEELTLANNALTHARGEVERLQGLLTQREEEMMALIDENEEIINEGPYERAERLNVLSKIVTEITPEPTIDILNDHTCLICLNNTDGPFIRTNKCNIDHGVCFSCFATLMNSPGKAQCPICMTKWEEGNLLIE
ncbi:Hypothetical protein GSB_154677 [Giardia duodenalis]|uniref:RING-type domain-containing protein n=1 Tax=Giardia intestinalis TaxID=5741 RepID=V6TPK8_GIAIN|nr:Hypothetical protein GSB_154677 [Giardia intestinalis]